MYDGALLPKNFRMLGGTSGVAISSRAALAGAALL
jgi:hypothetical protein